MKIPITPAISRWNSFIERYDLLTLYQHDRATPEQIRHWYHWYDPIIAPIFDQTARAAGYYFNGKQPLFGI